MTNNKTSKIEERVLALERAIEACNEKLKKLDEAASTIDEVKSSAAARDAVSEEIEVRLGKVEEQMGELASKLEAMILTQQIEWPAMEKKEDEDYTVVAGKKGRRGKGERAKRQGK